MFTYYHTYLPETWEAHFTRGLMDEHAGIKFAQASTERSADRKFNSLAAKGTPFEQTVRELKLPMYIDRLQGGEFFEAYPYDRALVNHYRELLGDNFLGFQMHEWMSNLSNDLYRINQSVTGEWTEKSITKGILAKFPFPLPYIETQSAADFAKIKNPTTFDEFYALARDLFTRRMKEHDGLLIPCDSEVLAFPFEIEAGARVFMPEIGEQIGETRVQLAYARGMSRAYGKSFGVYYEPWGGDPFSACCYQREGKNEWGLGDKSDFPCSTAGDNGGSSRSLQKRLHIYSYFAGADFISEEWGGCNTFTDWQDFELSPYGRVKYDFLQLVKKYPQEEIGTPYTPIAVVLPTDPPFLSRLQYAVTDEVLRYPLNETDKVKMRIIRQGLNDLFMQASNMVGCETTVMLNSDIPDAMDIIHEDKTGYTDYEYLVNLTGEAAFEKAHRCCAVEDVPALLDKLLPCTVEGGVHWFVNHTKKGWLLNIFNNNGIKRSVAEGEYRLPEGDREVRIRLKGDRNLVPLEGGEGLKLCGSTYTLTLQSGEWFLGKF